MEAGLVNKISAPGALKDDALYLARDLCERPPVAVRWVLKAMSAGFYEGLEEGLRVEAEGVPASTDEVEKLKNSC